MELYLYTITLLVVAEHQKETKSGGITLIVATLRNSVTKIFSRFFKILYVFI